MISAVNNCGHSHKVSDLLSYVPLYRYTIPLRATHQERLILSPLQIRGPSSRPRCSQSDKVSDLFEGTLAELRRLLEEAEGESSGSNESSSSSWDVNLGDEDLDEEAEVEDDEEVDQVPAAVPLAPAPLWQFIFRLSGNEEIMAPKVRTLGKGAKENSPQREPLNKKKEKDHETCVALGNAVMLPQDVADHAVETTVEFGGKLIMLGAQLIQRAVSSSLRLKQGTVDLKKANQKANSLEKELKQTKSELADAQSAAEIATLQQNQAQQEVSNLKAFACGEVYKKLFDRAFEQAGDVYERQLAELRPGIFQEGWLACLKELKIPLDHPAWSSPTPPIQLPASPTSPINLPDFNEEEYSTLPPDEENMNTAAAEARTGVEGTVDGDRAGEAEGDRAVEAKGENLV
ncbi:hypothetical protein Acr_06g0007150 [Actinidia rufa]|uniref:Uncharacterized protein n=1 Tax=Actinidia rufa TaxID=165716 RepID=A0A7J0EQK5_9ERIC|nr:hypothetical protein Acr_06g0007150 [Actinidia rufa]